MSRIDQIKESSVSNRYAGRNENYTGELCMFEHNEEENSIMLTDYQGYPLSFSDHLAVYYRLKKFINGKGAVHAIEEKARIIRRKFDKEMERELNPKPNVPKERKKIAGYVYFVQCNNKVKIGFSRNYIERIKIYKVASPFESKMLHVIKTDDCKKLEEYFHNRFASKRVEGEWFDLTEKDIKQICSGNYGNTAIQCSKVAIGEVM